MAHVQEQGPALVELGKSLTILHAARFRQLLLSALEARTAVVIEFQEDADAVLSFIQLIESARLFAAQQDREISISAPASGGVLDVLQRAGLTTEMSPESRAFWFHERTSL